MAKIYNLRNNKQNNKTQATQPVSLSLADRIIKAITPTVAKTAAKAIKSKGELNVPTRGTDISTPSVFNNKNYISGLAEVAVRTNKTVQAEMQKQQEAQQAEYERLHTTNFENEMQPGQWYEAIVDNKNVTSGTRLNDFGYLTVHCKDAKDGEYVHVNSNGEIILIEQSVMSEDERTKVDVFKRGYEAKRHEYDVYMGMQTLAKDGAETASYDITNTHQVNSVVDVLVNMFHDYAKNAHTHALLMDGRKPEQPLDYTRTIQTWKDYGLHSVNGRKLADWYINREYGKDWKEQYSGSTENIQKFLDLDEDQDLKEYMAYQIVTGDEVTFGDYAVRALEEVSEVGDLFATFTKPALIAADNFRYETLGNTEIPRLEGEADADYHVRVALAMQAQLRQATNQELFYIDKDHKYLGESYWDMLKAGFAPTWSETGRRVYEINTGSTITDLVLEVLSDPSFILSMGTKGLADATADTVTKAAKGSLGDLSERALKTTLREGVTKDITNQKLAVSIAKRIDPNASDDFIKTIADALDYSHAYKISKSLHGVSEAIDKVEDALLLFKLPAQKIVQGTVAGVNMLSNMNTLRAMNKCVLDACTEATAKVGGTIEMSNIEDFFKALDKNVLGINIAEGKSYLNMLSQEARVKVTADANIRVCNAIDDIITKAKARAKDFKESAIGKELDTPNTLVDDVSYLIRSKSNGKYATLEEYVDDVMRILKDNDVYDEEIVTRLRQTIDYYNSAIDTTRQLELADEIASFKRAYKMYFDTLKAIEFPKDKLKKFIKYKDYTNQAGIMKIMSFKDFYKLPAFSERLQGYMRYAFNPEKPMSFEDFFTQLKAKSSYKPLYQAQLDDKYTKYLQAISDKNKKAREEYLQVLKAHNEAAALNNQAVYKEACEKYKAYKNQMYKEIWQSYTDKNARIKHDNDSVIQSYLDDLSNSMHSIVNDILNRERLFLDTPLGQEVATNVSTLLDKGTLTKEEWDYVFDSINDAIKARQELAFTHMGVGTARMPYTENLVKESLWNVAPAHTYAEELDNTGLRRNIKDFGSMSAVEGKIYDAKLNRVYEANTMLADHTVNTMYQDIVDEGALGRAMLDYVQLGNSKSQLSKAVRAAIDDAYSAHRYQRLINRIDSAMYVPEDLKFALKDKLFSMDKHVKMLFEGYREPISRKPVGISSDIITSYSERTVHTWVDEALAHKAKSNELLSDLYPELKCDEEDTLANVRNIEKIFYENCELDAKRKSVPIFYSMKFYGESGGLIECSFRTTTGYEVTIKGSPRGGRIDQQRVYAQILDEIDKMKFEAGSQGGNALFVGFNNHATGRNTDKLFSTQAYHAGSQVKLLGTIDVAEQLRFKAGLPVVPEAAYAELEDILSYEFTKWYTDCGHTGCDLTLSLTPTVMGSSKFTSYMKNLNLYTEPQANAIGKHLKHLESRVESVQKTITKYNAQLAESGILYAEHGKNIMPIISKLPGEVIATKLHYDDRVISRYFDKALADGEKASELFDFAQSCDKVLGRIMDYQILDRYANSIKRAYHNMLKHPVAVEYLKNTGIEFKPAKEYKTSELFAIVYTVCHNIGGFKSMEALHAITRSNDMAKLFANAQTIVFRFGREVNVVENLHGSVVRDTSMLHTNDTILHQIEDMTQRLTKRISSIEAQEQTLRAAGLTGSLEYYKVLQKSEVAQSLTDYVHRTYARIEKYNKATAQKLNEVAANNPLSLRRLMVDMTDMRTKFSKAMYEFSKMHDKIRLQYIASQSPENLLGHLIKDCNGRMVISKETCDLNVVNMLLEKIDGLPHVKHDETDTHVRIWLNAKELSTEELDELVEKYSTFSLDSITHELYLDHAIIEDGPEGPIYDEDLLAFAQDNEKMLMDLTKYGPNSITYGMFTMNDSNLMYKMDNKFFSDISDEFLDFGTLNAMGNFKGQIACMYHGDLSTLAKSEMFISNDQFTNICNMYGHVINSLDETQNLISTVFNKNNNFASAVESFKELDGVSGRASIAKALKDNGYVAVVLTGDKHGMLSLHSIDVSIKEMYNAAMKSDYTTIMRYDTFRELQKQIANKNLATASARQTNKALSVWERSLGFYHTKIRYPFIQSYLFTKPATWMRNILDSGMKALLKEGTGYLQYIPEAMKTLDAYTEIENAIYTTYKRVDGATIKSYFDANPDIAMTKDMFVMLKSYWNNPLSGTQLEEIIKNFNIDPTSIFKRYTNLSLSKQDYEHVIEVYKKFHLPDVPINRRMSQINAELSNLYDSQTASTLTQMYERYAKLAAQGIGGSFLDDIPILNKWLSFNAERFNDVETINRLAIFLKRIESGDNMGQALLAIGETQFDYTKSDFMRAVETVMPFSTFKLYNYQYWLDSVWNYGVIEYMGDAAKVLMPEDEDGNYWTDENMSYRALIQAFLDTLPDDNTIPEYDSLLEYKGADGMDALENGWVRIGDKLYLKAGLSFIDVLEFGYVLGNPDQAPSFLWNNVFAPIQGFVEIIKDIPKLTSVTDKTRAVLQGVTQLGLPDVVAKEVLNTVTHTGDVNPYEMQDIVVREFVKEHEYDLFNLFPIVGTIYYSLYGTARNAIYATKDGEIDMQDALTLIPSLFAPAKGELAYDKYATSYYNKPVGFDWYNQSDEYRETHRYVMGVSYIPAYVKKDPATYIDTWGRMQQLGIPKEALPELFENGKSWWFTRDDYGTYKLHNYQLMIKDETAYTEIYNTLLKYGWTSSQAEQLMAEVAIPMWDNSPKGNVNDIKGYGSYKYMNATSVLNTALSGSKAALNTAKYNMGRYNGNGKWSQYDTMPSTYRRRVHQVKGHDVSRLSKKYQKAYRWHRRTRDIYHDNYAKYGASRMAMEQNLRAYSNRSITEMRRTNMNIRYARIHNRWWAS